MLFKSISKNGFILTLFALATTGAVTLTQLATADKIEQQAQLQLKNMLQEVLPKSAYNNQLVSDCIEVKDDLLGHQQTQRAYRAHNDGQPSAIIIPSTAPDGYSGNIEIISAIYLDGRVAGVRVIKHKETPGLGDKIELKRSDWISSFNGLTAESEEDSRWAVKKEGGQFDAFTGATITPRAVINAVKRSSLFIQQHQQTLFAQANQCGQ